jgi:hypothetical protein
MDSVPFEIVVPNKHCRGRTPQNSVHCGNQGDTIDDKIVVGDNSSEGEGRRAATLGSQDTRDWTGHSSAACLGEQEGRVNFDYPVDEDDEVEGFFGTQFIRRRKA